MSASQFTDQDIYDFKIFKSLRDYVPNLLFNVAKDLYHKHNDSKNGTLSIEEFLKKVGDNSEIHEDISKLKFDYKNESMDVYLDINKCSCLILILKKHGSIFGEHGESIFNSVTKVRNIRNKFCKCTLKTEELKELKNELIKGIRSICEQMKRFFHRSNATGKDYSDLGERVICEIENFWELNIGDESVTELVKAKNDKYRKLLSKCHQHLTDVYKTYNESSPLLQEKFKFNIEAVFIEPSLKERDKDSSVSYKEILHKKLEKQEAEPPVVIISADAGHGKTTICRKLTLDWCKSNDFEYDVDWFNLDDYDLLLLIEVKRANETGICQYLKEILLQDSLLNVNATDDEIILFLSQLNLLIIIDAYDEKAKEANTLIRSVLEFFADKKIFITTRPHYLNQITEVLKENGLLYLNVELEGFKDETEYIKKVWKHLKEDKKFNMNICKFLNFVKELPEDFKKLLRVPLITFLLIYLWVSQENDEKSLKTKTLRMLTFTNLYKQIVELQKETIKKKIIQNTEEKNPLDIIEKIIGNFFSKLSESCYTQLTETSKDQVMSSYCIEEMKSYLEKKLDEHRMDRKYVSTFMSTIFMSSRNIRDIKDENNLQYEFLHKTQYEYFIAYHASHLLEVDGSNSLKMLDIFNKENLMTNINEFSFLLGILNEKGILEKFISNIIDILKMVLDDYDILWKFLSQTISDHSKKESVNEFRPNNKLCECYKNEFKLKSTFRLKDRNVISGLSILCYVDFKPKEIIIDLTTNPNEIPSLEQSFSKVITSLNKCKERNKTILEIDFNNHKKKSDKDEKRSSDGILEHLKLGRNLNMKKFTGHIEKIETVKILDTFTDLVRIDIRVATVPVLEELIKACNNNKKKLKWVFIIFDEPFSKEDTNKLPKLNMDVKNRNICVIYNNVEDIYLAIDNLTAMKPTNDRLFFSVELDVATTLEGSPKQWLKKIHNKRLIDEKLTVRSSYEMGDDERELLRKSLHYKLRWNE